MAVHFRVLIRKKPSIAGGQIDIENDSAPFIHAAADEQLTVGGDIRHSQKENDMAKRIRARVEIKGAVKWVAGATQQEAILAAAKLLAEANGEGENNRTKKEAPLFRDYAQMWFDTYKKPSLRIKAVTDYGLNLKKHLNPFLGDMRIDEIKVLDVQRFMNTKMDKAFSTVHKYKVMLNRIFCSAIEDGWRLDNPIDSRRIKLPKRTREREALTLEDAKDIISSWYLLGERERCLLALYLYAGIRRGKLKNI